MTILTNDRTVLWFRQDLHWTVSLNTQLKRLFQKSPTTPHRLLVRHLLKEGNLADVFKYFKNTTEIKLCYVECGMLDNPSNNYIIGEFMVYQLRRFWLGFPKETGYQSEVLAPFYEFEGLFRPVNALPFGDVFYS